MPDFGKCRGCGATMRWITMESGRKNPLDPEPNPAGNVILISFAEAMRGRALPTAERDRLLALPEDERPFIYMSHFATCPAREQFKKPAQGALDV